MTVEHRPPRGKYRLTIDDFMLIDGTGVLGTDRTELLDGDIIIMNAEYRPHGWIVGELGHQMRRRLEEAGSEFTTLTASVAVSDHDMPLPDIVLTREPQGEGPIPLRSVGLIVEVASSTLGRDMRDKMAMYGRAGVPEYWVVDVEGRTIHQMWEPADGKFAQIQEIVFGRPVVAATISALAIDTVEF